MRELINEIRGLLLLLSTLVLSTVFLLFKSGDYKTYYPYFPLNQDVVLTRDTYFYFLNERMILVVLTLFIYLESTKYKLALGVFVLIHVVDTLDYLLTYNATWYFLNIPVSWDILKVSIFCLAISKEVLTMLEKRMSL